MRWDVPRKGWLLLRGGDGPYGLVATAGESLQSGDLRDMRRIDEERRGLARGCIGRIEEGSNPVAPIAELRRAGLEIEWHGRRSGWQVVGDDGVRYGRADTICGREPGALDQVLERACGRGERQQHAHPAPARGRSAAGRLARSAVAEGVGIVAEGLQGLVADGPPPDDHVADARAALSVVELSGNAKRVSDARNRVARAEQAHQEALRRWDERQRRQAEARRTAQERKRRERDDRGRWAGAIFEQRKASLQDESQTMLSITLPAEVEERLDALEKTSGRSKAALVCEAVMEYLDDLEDLHIAEERLARHRASGEAGIPLETVMKQHGMDS